MTLRLFDKVRGAPSDVEARQLHRVIRSGVEG